ncbi:MFS transporter [Nitrospinaceae bacterium]|nr:MFS transporter [Nitrospinaceae bacterium]
MNILKPDRSNESSIGYFPFLKQNPSFRNLWYGQVISELGNWVNSIALYALILQLTGSGMAMAAAMMAKLLPMVIISPFAGVVIDRMDRRTILIASDILRCFTVLCFLIVESREDLWLVYALTLFEVALTGFFEPARSAILPSIVKKNHLVTANAISGATWSIMLTLGAALGGFVVSLFGVKAAFILDALTYLLSAWFIIKISYPNTKSEEPIKKNNSSGIKGLLGGGRYLISHPIVLALALLKSGMAIKGGIMTLIPLFANRLWSDPAAVSVAVGIMFSSRGIGSAIGPILIRKWLGESPKILEGSILAAFFLGSLALLAFSVSKNLWLTSLCIGLSGMFGSIVWVFSTALIHLEADRQFLGRIFGIEMALLTLIMGISNGVVGVAIDGLQMTIQSVILWMSGLYMIPGILWIIFLASGTKLKKS